MASVTQKIPSYVLGMSTQPDEKKVPGQVVDLVNGVPDVVNQLTKRPGSQLINNIQPTSPSDPNTGQTTKWFNIYTDDEEQYIGQTGPDGAAKIWRCSDGVEIPIDYALVAGTNKATYLDNQALSDEKSSDIQVMTINETTFFVNRRKTVAMKTGALDKSPPQLNEAFISLDTISYGKQYALDIYDPADNTTITYPRATGITVASIDAPHDAGQKTGTYTQSGTTVNVSISGHGLSVNDRVTLDFTSGTAVDGVFTVASTSTNNSFAVTAASGASTNGNVTLKVTDYTGTSNGDCKGAGRETVNVETGTSKCDTSPPNNSATGKANLRYELDTRCTPQINDDGDDTTVDNYHDTYQCYVKLQFGGENWTTNDTHTHTSSKGVTTTTTIKSHVNVISRANVAAVRPSATSSNAEEHVSSNGILGDLKTTLDAISGTGITATISGNGIHLYRATPFGVTSPEKQLMTVTTTEANNIAELPRVCRHGYTVRIVNSGEDMDDYYLRFQAEGVAADIIQQATYTRSGSTITVTSPAHGLSNGSEVILDVLSGNGSDGYYTIGVPNADTFTITDTSSGSTSGDVTVHPVRFGEGVWEECAEPGITTTFDNTTMPLKLTRVLPGTFSINGGSAQSYTNGAFQFGYPDWGKRDVGDDITNGEPSFVGHRIQKMIFFRNRIALLSEENVILSRVNDFYNFWVKTAMAISNADPIDLQSSSTYPTRLFDAVENSGGLVVFSASEQFLLSSGAEALLTPETAKITYAASYAYNPDSNPVSLGTTIGFLNSTAREARFYEIADVSTRGEPVVEEQSKIIAELFPQNLTNVTASTENSLLLFAVDSTLHTATNEIWGYKWYQAGDQRAQSAWFRWTLPNNVIFHCIMDDQYFVVLFDPIDEMYTLEKFDIKLTTSTPVIGSPPDENRVHLDTKKTFASSALTHNTVTDVTTFNLGLGFHSNRTLTAYCITDSDAAGKSYDIPASAITGSLGNETVTLPGNWKTAIKTIRNADGSILSQNTVNTDVVIGYEYEFEVELPKVYVTRSEGDKSRSETRGSLVLHRMNFDFGDVGVLDITLKRKGRDDYTYTVESKEWDNINASTAAIASGYIHTIPVYDRNTNLSVFIKSNHPSPATLHSMNWEGDYSPRYYQRV